MTGGEFKHAKNGAESTETCMIKKLPPVLPPLPPHTKVCMALKSESNGNCKGRAGLEKSKAPQVRQLKSVANSKKAAACQKAEENKGDNQGKEGNRAWDVPEKSEKRFVNATSKQASLKLEKASLISSTKSGSGQMYCRYKWCAANEPNYAFSSPDKPKKYLTCKRRLVKAQVPPQSKNKTGSSLLVEEIKLDTQFKDEAPSSCIHAVQEGNQNYSDAASSRTSEFVNGTEETPEIGNESQTKTHDDFTKLDIRQEDEKTSCGKSYSDDASQISLNLDHGFQESSTTKDDQAFFQYKAGYRMDSAMEQLNDKIPFGLNRVRRSFSVPAPEQEAETVKLRRQLMEDRKQAGEWMIDSAIEGAIRRLAPNGEMKVRVLVEAFESILAHKNGETSKYWTGSEENLHGTQIAMSC